MTYLYPTVQLLFGGSILGAKINWNYFGIFQVGAWETTPSEGDITDSWWGDMAL